MIAYTYFFLLVAVAVVQATISVRSKSDLVQTAEEQTKQLTILKAANITTSPYDYPLLKQCDDKWGDDLMVTKTVCQVGCLMSSTSMGLAGTKIGIPSPTDPQPSPDNATPGSLNEWLKENDGYDSSNDFIEPAAQAINPDRVVWPDDAMHKTNDLSYDTVASYIQQGRIVIGNVMNGGHFVLLTGYSDDKDTFAVNDPGFNTLTYSYSKDIVGYRIFDMAR